MARKLGPLGNRLKIQPIYLVSREPGLALARVRLQERHPNPRTALVPF
jgi:hypothetical protein